MSNIQVGQDSIASGIDEISSATNRAIDGLEKAKQVMAGLHDYILLVGSSFDQWENKSFAARANEIEHQSKLGKISIEEEAQLWKALTDEKIYGWQNVGVAEENYHKKMYESSKKWIDDQTTLGKLSAQEIAQAWKRVYDEFDDINIKYEAALKIRDVLLGEQDSSTSERRTDSNRWMQSQDVRDGGDLTLQVDDYTRRIETEKELLSKIQSGTLNGVQLGWEEQNKRWTETYNYIGDLEDKRYKASKEYLDKQVNDYINAAAKKLEADYSGQNELYQKELSAIDEKYAEIDRSEQSSKRSAELADLERLQAYYKNAVTVEGQDKLKQIQDKISSLYSAQVSADREVQKQQEKDDIQDKIDKAKVQYENSKAELENTKTAMLETSEQIANQSTLNTISAGNKIKDTLLKTSQVFSTQIEDMFKTSEGRLSGYIDSISSMLGTVGGYGAGNVSSGNVSVTLNDYGDKLLEDNSAVSSYANEIMSVFKNTIRVQGVR